MCLHPTAAVAEWSKAADLSYTIDLCSRERREFKPRPQQHRVGTLFLVSYMACLYVFGLRGIVWHVMRLGGAGHEGTCLVSLFAYTRTVGLLMLNDNKQ